ncbi:MAG: GGDEF domain-containing protein, partial [Cyanobacteria bacterium]|nr:GGDEF domain-containing protein [Cyanobacteriota bacterium]
ATWINAIRVIYGCADFVTYPLAFIYNILHFLVSSVETSWFPQLKSTVVSQALQDFLKVSPWIPVPQPWKDAMEAGQFNDAAAGVFAWKYLIMLPVLGMLSHWLDDWVEFGKNLFWNIFVEFSFTKRKQAQYQEALEKKSDALMKLYTQKRETDMEKSVLESSVITDEMTQIFNKRFFVQKMTEEFEKAKKNRTPLALVMMDIDHFKKFNDTYGHLLGDKVLIKVAEVAKKMTPSHSYCCRYGGEEFGIIIPGKTFEEALKICDNVRLNIPLIRLEEDPEIRITLSQGLIVLDFESLETSGFQDYNEIVKLADRELYRAKDEGRNRVCYVRMDHQDTTR